MRIVMVAPKIGSAFGQERAVSQTAELLEGAGCEVFTVADYSIGGAADLEITGLSSVHSLSARSKVKAALDQLGTFLRSTKPDIIHVHDAFDPRITLALSKYAPLIYTPHTVSFSCPSSTRLRGDGKACDKKSGWSCLAYHQSFQCLDGYRTTLHRTHMIHGYLTRVKALKEHARKTIAISEYVCELLRNEGWPSIGKVPNAVYVSPWSQVSPSSGYEFVYAARLTAMKGLADLLLALSKVSVQNWSLKVCGEGSERGKLEQQSRSLGIGSRVEFLGRLEPAATAQLVSRAAALVAPNRGPETFGLSVAEACFMGVPVVAAKVRGLDEIIRDETEGYLFESGNVEDLKTCLETVLKDKNEATQRAKKASASVRSRFSKERHVDALLENYRQVTGYSFKPERSENTFGLRSPSSD